MVEGKRKSRSVRRLNRVTPTGKRVTHYVSRKPAKAQCAGCGTYLKGVARASHNKMQNMSKSQKRPERPFGGVFCSSCSRQKIASKFRSMFSLKK
jgi:large subunit ribosomal protein L34e